MAPWRPARTASPRTPAGPRATARVRTWTAPAARARPTRPVRRRWRRGRGRSRPGGADGAGGAGAGRGRRGSRGRRRSRRGRGRWRRRRLAPVGQAIERLLDRPVLPELGEGAVEHQTPAVDQQHAVGGRLGLVEDMRRDEQRLRRAQALDVVAKLADLVGIESGRRLVHDQDVGIVQQRLGQAHALLEPLRQPADRLLDHQPQRTQLDDGVDAALEGLPELARLAEEGEQLERRHVGIQRAVLRQVSQAPGRLDAMLPHVHPADGRAARAGRQIPRQHPHHRGLARAVGPEEGHDLTLGYRKGNVAHRDERTEVLAQSLRLDHRRARLELRRVHHQPPSLASVL